MNAFDELEKQLRRGVRELAPKRPRARRLRLLAVALPVVAVAGVAGATGLVDRPTAAKRADVLVRRITADTASDPACARPTHGGRRPTRATSDARPLPEIVRILPTMGDPSASSPPRRLVRRAQRVPAGGTVMRRTVRLARFPDGTEVLVFVTIGGSAGLTVVDPAGCRTARLRALGTMKDVDVAVRDRAREVLELRPDTDPRAQSLVTSDGVSGGATPIRPGHPLSTRRWFSTGSAFTGIAHRRAVTVAVQRLRPGPGRRVWRGDGAFAARIPVRHGVYGFEGRGGTDGRYRIVQYDAAGRVVRRAILPE